MSVTSTSPFFTRDISAALGTTLTVPLPSTALIDVPVLVANGAKDEFYCAVDCTRGQVLAQEQAYFAGAPCLDAAVMPDAGHDINLHPSAPAYQAKVLAWADAVTGGGCPDGT